MSETIEDKAAIMRAERLQRDIRRDQESRAWDAIMAIRAAVEACSAAQHSIAATDYTGEDASIPIEGINNAKGNLGFAMQDLIRLVARGQFDSPLPPLEGS